MIYKTIHPLPFLSITLKTGPQEDLGLDALYVIANTPSSSIRLAVLSTSHPKLDIDGRVRTDGTAATAEELIQHLDRTHFNQDRDGFFALMGYARRHFAEMGAVADFSAIEETFDHWTVAMDQWLYVTLDGDIRPERVQEAGALLTLTTKIPTPPGPLRASESVLAFAGFLPTLDDRCTKEIENLILAFCAVHELPPPRPGYQGLLRRFVDNAPEFMIAPIQPNPEDSVSKLPN